MRPTEFLRQKSQETRSPSGPHICLFFDAAGNGLNRRRQRVAVAGCVASKFRRPSKGEGGDREEASDGEGSDRKARAIAS